MPRKMKKQIENISLEQKAKIENVKRLRELIKTKFWPFLLYQDWSIEEVGIFLQLSTSFIEQEYMKKRKQIKLNEMGFEKVVSSDDPWKENYKKVFEMLLDETVEDAEVVLEGMNSAIKKVLEQENNKRKLESITKEIEKNFV